MAERGKTSPEREALAEAKALKLEMALRRIMNVSGEGGPSAQARMYDIARTALREIA